MNIGLLLNPLDWDAQSVGRARQKIKSSSKLAKGHYFDMYTERIASYDFRDSA